MPKITAVIVSFLRSQYTIDCVRTLHETCPKIKILVGENGNYDKDIEEAVKKAKGQYILYPFDSGNSFVRNRLVEKAKTKYVLIGDDDFWYDEGMKADEMVKFLENTDFDLIGGRASYPDRVGKREHRYFIEEHPDHIEFKLASTDNLEVEPESGLNYIVCDSVAQFFVAKRKSLVKWDERFTGSYEHPKFFIDMKQAGRKVAFTPDSMVWHKKQGNLNSEEYKSHRWGTKDRNQFLDVLGVEYFLRGGEMIGKRKGPLRREVYYATRTVRIDGRLYNRGDIVKTRKPHPYLIRKSRMIKP